MGGRQSWAMGGIVFSMGRFSLRQSLETVGCVCARVCVAVVGGGWWVGWGVRGSSSIL